MTPHSFLSITFAGVLLAAPIAHAAGTPTDQCVARSSAALQALLRGDYVGTRKDFNAAVSQAVSAAALEQVWAQLQSQAGAYQEHAEPQRQNLGDQKVVITTLSFANMPLNYVVACDDDGRISSFRFIPAEAAARSAAPTPTAAHTRADGVHAQPLAVTSPLGPLSGVLTLPAGKGPFPAVLLVAGSGPHDRDETIGPNKPFRDIADGLAAAGIASLRYDKRSHVYGTQMAGKAITVDDEVTDDALSALRELGQQPSIDARRLFVLGHSLGALMAPRIGERAPQVAGLILLAAPASFGLDTVVRQTRYIGYLNGASADELDEATAPIIKARDALARADPATPPSGSFFNAPASYWLSLRDYNAVTVAKTLRVPMLVLQGSGDYQVTPREDFIHWQKAFARSTRVRLQEYPGLSHLFMPASQPPTPADYDKPGHVDAQVIRDIAAWVEAQPAHF